MICSMKRTLLAAVERIPLAPALVLAAKSAWDARLREPASALAGDLARWHQAMMRDGVHVVENFLDRAQCEALREQVAALMAAYPAAVQVDKEGADRRLFLGATPPGPLGGVYSDARLAALAGASLGGGVINLATLAGHITAIPGNLGSGGGWHRDSYTNQFKTILYLTDVDEDHGPFQFIKRSHRLGAMIHDRRIAAMTLGQSRIGNDQIEALIAEEPRRLMTLTGPAGTLVLTDTTGIHRGMPIRAGERVALTNYYYPRKLVSGWTYDHFKPVLGRHLAY